MAYIVPNEIPKFCNKCPFGVCAYSKPDWGRECVNRYDGEMDKPNTHGYRCQCVSVDSENRSKVLRADYDADIEKPDWCPLKEIEESEGER